MLISSTLICILLCMSCGLINKNKIFVKREEKVRTSAYFVYHIMHMEQLSGKLVAKQEQRDTNITLHC